MLLKLKTNIFIKSLVLFFFLILFSIILGYSLSSIGNYDLTRQHFNIKPYPTFFKILLKNTFCAIIFGFPIIGKISFIWNFLYATFSITYYLYLFGLVSTSVRLLHLPLEVYSFCLSMFLPSILSKDSSKYFKEYLITFILIILAAKIESLIGMQL